MTSSHEEYCKVCGGPVEQMAYYNTGFCGQVHWAQWHREHPEPLLYTLTRTELIRLCESAGLDGETGEKMWEDLQHNTI